MRRLTLLTFAALFLCGAAARAEPPILEVHSSLRPADADALLGPVATELAAAGFEGTRATAAKVEAKLSLPGRAASEAELADAIRRIDVGEKRVVAGEFEQAVAELGAGLATLRRSIASLAGSDRGRDAAMRALVGLALSYKRIGPSEKATEAMAELIRSFPDREISYADYGPEPRELYRRVRRSLEEEGKGGLAIAVDDAETVVFVNERYVGVGSVTVPDLFRGTYRVYLQQGTRRGRVHRVAVEAGPPTSLSVSWRFDAALSTDHGVAALIFDDAEQRRAEEARQAVRIGRALDAASVAVLGFREVAGQRHVVGQVYFVDTSKEARSASVSLDPVAPSADRLRALGRYLAGDESAAALVQPLEAAPVGEATADAPARPGFRFGGWRWVTLVGGVAGLATGGALVAVHEPELLEDGSRNTEVRETRTAGFIIGGVSAALTCLSLYMFVHDARQPEPTRAVTVAPTEGGATVGISGVF